jgi:S1-C subfamily serine protease
MPWLRRIFALFSNALEIVGKFTFPVAFTRRFRNGNLSSSLGTFIVVNADGWILTAHHILKEILRATDSQTQIQQYEADKKAIEDNPQVNAKDKRKRIQKLLVSNDWITNQAILWGFQPWVMDQYFEDELADLALIRMDNFDPALVTGYPVFRDPANPLKPGTSLCRLGYPFHEIKATFDGATQSFTLDPATFPIVRFPNDGILTRFVRKNSADGTRHVLFIETSMAGLRGQSGGPIFDVNGNIWGIQSQTSSLPLGFSPTYRQGTKEIVEHQFMHLGWGTHVQHAIDLMRNNNVKFDMQP